MARKIYDPSDDESSDSAQSIDLQTQTRELYTNFVREEIQLQGLVVPSDVPSLVVLTLCLLFTKMNYISCF